MTVASRDRFVTTPDAFRLLMDGQAALAEVEAHGVRVDKAYLESALVDCAARVRDHEQAIRADPVYKTWRRRYGDKTNVHSAEQIARVVFEDLGFKATEYTAGSYDDWGNLTDDARPSATEAALESIDLPVVKHYLESQRLVKAKSTYLGGIRREMVRHPDGTWRVHPSYNLNTVASFRRSCDGPNWQNQPNRIPWLAEMIRRCYIPMPGHQIMEFDFKQIEVGMSCPYHHDPVLMEYVRDDTKDMHRDTGCDLFRLEPRELSKLARHVAKNMVVFPLMYGSYYAQCAPNVWQAIDQLKITVEHRTGADGNPVTLREHLTARGMTELGACDPKQRPRPGTFEAHVQSIEEDFWGTRFRVYAQWKRDWYAAYLRDGGFRTNTGFGIRTHMSKEGVLNRKQVCNLPIQCDASQCNLWSVVRIVRRLRKHGFRSRVIGEIHDCVVMDVDPAERDDVIDLCRTTMVDHLMRAWAWINVPLVVEVEACPVDQSWYCKMSLARRGDRWEPSDMGKWAKLYGAWDGRGAA